MKLIDKLGCIVVSAFFIIALCVGILNITPVGRGIINTYKYQVQKVDDVTNYKTMKKVEDTCRTMIASYEADKLMYLQYKDSDHEEKQTWAEQAKIRANKTAVSYNTFILENNYVWKDNVPNDIAYELELIE